MQHFGYPKEFEPVEYSDDEKAYRGYLIEKMNRSRNLREDQHDELDGMTYTDYFQTNARAANSYIPPKQNEKDSRIVTGITEGKVESMLSALLNLNLDPNITAYDESNEELSELGENFELLVKKSREIETPDYDVKRPLIYKELLDQGDVFVEETFVEAKQIQKKLKKGFKWSDAMKMSKIWDEDSVIHEECAVRVISGMNVYAGNVRDFYIDTQPFMFVRDYITYEEADMLFGNWPRFKHVPAKLEHFNQAPDTSDYQDWTLLAVDSGFVEVIRYYCKPTDEMQILLNGVMMLPIGFPMSGVLGHNEYPIRKGSVSPISKFFFYSKSVASKAKIDQAVIDEFLRLFIHKTQKSVKPSMANNTGRQLSSKIFDPAVIVNDIDPNKLQEIGRNEGVTNSEFAVYDLLRREIDAKSVSPVFQGQSATGSQTATEASILMKQSMQNFGVTIWGVMNLEKGMAWLRLHNIIRNWTKTQDQRVNKFKGKLIDVFKKIEMDDTFEDGTEGTRTIEFTEEVPDSAQVMGMEKFMKGRGKNARLSFIHPKLLRETRINWRITITPTEKQTDAVDRAQFEQSLQTIAGVFVPVGKIPDWDYLGTVWSKKAKLDPEKVWKQAPPPQMGPLAPPGPGQMAQEMIPPGPPTPSVNTLMNA